MTDIQTSDILIKISGDAAVIANNDDRIPDLALQGTIFTTSHSPTKLAIDYNQKDVIYAWLATKERSIRWHKTRPYGPNRDIRTVEALFQTLDQIAYDSIVQAVEENLKTSQNTDAPLLAMLLDNVRNGQ